jgi:hypothetical protein
MVLGAIIAGGASILGGVLGARGASNAADAQAAAARYQADLAHRQFETSRRDAINFRNQNQALASGFHQNAFPIAQNAFQRNNVLAHQGYGRDVGAVQNQFLRNIGYADTGFQGASTQALNAFQRGNRFAQDAYGRDVRLANNAFDRVSDIARRTHGRQVDAFRGAAGDAIGTIQGWGS